MAEQAYAIIAIVATTITNTDGTTTAVSPGYVLNRAMWDGVSEWSPPPGTEVRADAAGSLAIGQTTTV
jgi:hypothetical protein